MEIYKIAIIIVVVYIIIYNLTLGFSLFNKKHTVIIYDCDTEDLQKIGFQCAINRYPYNTIDIEYDKDEKVAVVVLAFDILMITGIEGKRSVQIDHTIYHGISDSVLITNLKGLDFRIEGEFKRQIVENINENTVLTFPEKKRLIRIRENGDDEFNFIIKGGKTKVLNIVFIPPNDSPLHLPAAPVVAPAVATPAVAPPAVATPAVATPAVAPAATPAVAPPTPTEPA